MKTLIIISLLLLSATITASGLEGLDANKFRWAESHLQQYKTTSGSSKEISKMRVENYISEIHGLLETNKDDPEYSKYKKRLDKLKAQLNEGSQASGIPDNLSEAKSNIYWAKGKIDYAIQDPNYGASEANLNSAQSYLNRAEEILYSANYKQASGEYKQLLDLYAKLREDLDKLISAKAK